MNQNNFNQLSRYEDVFSDFSEVLNEFLTVTDGEEIRKFNLKQAKKGYKTKVENKLIEDDFTPDELIEEIKKSYLSRDYLKGEIGIVDGNEQYDGIFNIALYMLMTNRLGKQYKSILEEDSTIDETTKNEYQEKYRELMSKKQDATTKLIYSLYIYKETENDDDFYYGYKYDKRKGYLNDSFIIDLPIYGQISVHFGSKKKFESIKYLAKQNIDLILEKKMELGQITEEQFNKIKEKADTDEILSRYTGKQYEFVSGIPLDYQGKKFEKAQNDLGLSEKLPTEITDEDIKNISKDINYNTRELYYFAIKRDFSKSQLEKLSQLLKERDKANSKKLKKQKSEKFKNEEKQNLKEETINAKLLGQQAVELTTAEERQQVATHEVISNEIEKNSAQEK